MRRSAVSVPANIAEGFKPYSKQEKIRFYNISEGSLEELKYYLILSRGLSFSVDDQISEQAVSVSRLLYRLIESIRNQI